MTDIKHIFSFYRFLASGDSQISLAWSYRLGRATVMRAIHSVFSSIVRRMMDIYLPSPDENMWREVAAGFDKWNFPNCLGALDGKHINIVAVMEPVAPSTGRPPARPTRRRSSLHAPAADQEETPSSSSSANQRPRRPTRGTADPGTNAAS